MGFLRQPLRRICENHRGSHARLIRYLSGFNILVIFLKMEERVLTKFYHLSFERDDFSWVSNTQNALEKFFSDPRFDNNILREILSSINYDTDKCCWLPAQFLKDCWVTRKFGLLFL